jgi:hypothetical protein
MQTERDQSVEKWLGRLSPSTAKINEYHLGRWMIWVKEHGGKFSEFSPSQMIEYQAAAQNREAYELLDLIQRYVGEVKGRHGYKAKVYSSLRSFFTHNRVQLPADPQYIIRAEKPKATGSLKPEVIRRIVLSSRGVYRAAFLSILQGGMDLAGFEAWNLEGWESLKAALDRGDDVHTIELPGRKKFRNIRPYKTRIGGDALDAIRLYVPKRPGNSAIFYDQYKGPLSKNSLQLYWKRCLIKLGYMKPKNNGDPGNRYGKNLHELRDSFRTLWSMSGAAPHVAEAMMGHTWDPLGYDKSPDDDKFAMEQYRKALRFLNILSSGEAFGQVDAGEVEKLRAQVKALEAGQGGEVQALRAEVGSLGDTVRLLMERLEKQEKTRRE